jgi:putative ABC transport system ATP-binding protein
MDNAIVSLENVSRTYDSGNIQAVTNLSLQVMRGEFVALLGASGSGKTTLLNLMTGLDAPTGGLVRFNGSIPATRTRWCALRSRHIGFIFQSFNLLPTLTALENVEIPMFGNGMNASQRQARANELLERVGLSTRASHLPSQLSGGERQRVAIARSLANQPTLLVADEPTGNLDSHTAEQIMALLERVHLSEKSALFLVTHDQRFAARATRVVQIADGKIVT